MALVIKGQPMQENGIIDWIEESFKFYRHVLYDDFHYERLYSAFGKFEVPAVKNYDDGSWEVCIDEARVYLGHLLGPKARGTFPFLDLPPELRNTIYQMVLQFPRSGLMFDTNFGTHPELFRILTKDKSQPFSGSAWKATRTWAGSGPYRQSARKALSILLVNKQILAEALSCFYHNNLFCLWGTESCFAFLSRLPLSRR